MLAIDGPTDIMRAPVGTLRSIQRPASRPPGTPPEPARKLVTFDGCTFCQLGIAIDAATTTMAPARSQVRVAGRLRARASGVQCTRKRAARIATAGAIGSRY